MFEVGKTYARQGTGDVLRQSRYKCTYIGLSHAVLVHLDEEAKKTKEIMVPTDVTNWKEVKEKVKLTYYIEAYESCVAFGSIKLNLSTTIPSPSSRTLAITGPHVFECEDTK